MMKRIITMAYLIQKRLFKKPSFIIILLLIPLAVISVMTVAKKEATFLKIAVYPGNSADKSLKSVISNILEHEDIINFEFFEDAATAKNAVAYGKADGAWIFPANFEDSITKFVNNPSSNEELIEIYYQEENIPTKLSNELLFGSVFPEIAKKIYLNYINNDLKLKDKFSEEELLNIYDRINTGDKIITFVDADGEENPKTEYLISPVRGVLSIFIMISAFASAMYFYSDSNMGAFTVMPKKRRLFLLLCSVFFGAFDCAAVSFISLCFTPLFTSFGIELFSLLLLVLNVSAFSAFFSVLLAKPERIGVFSVFMSLFVFAFCPIFFTFKVPVIQSLLPQTYYLNAYTANSLIFELLLFSGYLISTVSFFFLAERIRKKQ
ncbi:MAG TPA: hypothetical protein DEW35_00310 [Ruminococcaceae bacterium]|nr:hypothetical protein [Oscillospiraceae bacterium]